MSVPLMQLLESDLSRRRRRPAVTASVRRVRRGGDAQHAAAAGDEGAVLGDGGAGVVDGDVSAPGSWPLVRPEMGLPFS